jgi:hypothetical protein
MLPMLPICYTCQFSADHRVPQGPLLKPRRQGANPDLIPATLGVLHDAGHRLQQARRQKGADGGGVAVFESWRCITTCVYDMMYYE